MINFLEKLNLENYTMIVPSVTIGNVAQLTTDLLISTLEMKKIGTLWDPSIIPIIGPPAFSHDKGITTASDLYASEKHKLIILQLRSPIIKALMGALFDKLTDFIRTAKLEKLIILTGSYAHEKHYVEQSPIAYQSNTKFDRSYDQKMQELKWTRNSTDIIRGGGYADVLFKRATQKDIPTMVLYKYVSEGDNSDDAVHILDTLNNFLDIVPKHENGDLDIKKPSSWKFLFGSPAPQSIY